jgi:hypothetical protein
MTDESKTPTPVPIPRPPDEIPPEGETKPPYNPGGANPPHIEGGPIDPYPDIGGPAPQPHPEHPIVLPPGQPENPGEPPVIDTDPPVPQDPGAIAIANSQAMVAYLEANLPETLERETAIVRYREAAMWAAVAPGGQS